MTARLERIDPETPLNVVNRFGITTLAADLEAGTIVASMPIAGMTNPLTGLPTIAGLAVLVDDVAGRANYYRTSREQWTVSSELTVDINPVAYSSLVAAPDEPVIASARGWERLGPHCCRCAILSTPGNRSVWARCTPWPWRADPTRRSPAEPTRSSGHRRPRSRI